MKDADLTETEVASETVFQGRLLRVKRDTVRLHDGQPRRASTSSTAAR